MSGNTSHKILAYVNGYDQNVSGSNFYVTAVWPDGYKLHFVVECGQYYGKEMELNSSFPYKPSGVDLAFLTHCHIDHCGRFPKLIHDGFQGPIYATKGTALLYPNAIRNSGNIVIANNKRQGQKPDFDTVDIETSIQNIVQHQKDYDIEYEYKGRLYFKFIRNCHLFGASSILIRLSDPSKDVDDVTLFFLGDYNDKNLFVPYREVPRCVQNTEISAFFTESTYGDSESDAIEYHFYDYLRKSIQNYHTTIFFAFSLGRSQDILYLLKKAQESLWLPTEIPIYLDGSLTISDTLLVYKNPDVLDIREDARNFLPDNLQLIDKGIRPNIIETREKKIIVTSSGMGTYGPARDYIHSLIDVSNVCMIFGGYCTDDSIGRSLMNVPIGEETKVFGQDRIKRATVCYLEELSGHARADRLVRHLSNFRYKSVLINHGEPEKQESLKNRIINELHPSKGVFTVSREVTFRVTSYGVDKHFFGVPNEF